MSKRKTIATIDNLHNEVLRKLSTSNSMTSAGQNIFENSFTDDLRAFWASIMEAQDHLDDDDLIELLRIAAGIADANDYHQLKNRLTEHSKKHESREKAWKYVNVSIFTVAVAFLVIALVFSAPGLLIVPALGFAAGWGIDVARSYFSNETPKHEANALEALSFFTKTSKLPAEYEEIFTAPITP